MHRVPSRYIYIYIYTKFNECTRSCICIDISMVTLYEAAAYRAFYYTSYTLDFLNVIVRVAASTIVKLILSISLSLSLCDASKPFFETNGPQKKFYLYQLLIYLGYSIYLSSRPNFLARDTQRFIIIICYPERAKDTELAKHIHIILTKRWRGGIHFFLWKNTAFMCGWNLII